MHSIKYSPTATRSLQQWAPLIVSLVIVTSIVTVNLLAPFFSAPETNMEKALRILDQAPIIDGQIRFYLNSSINDADLTTLPETFDTDITRLRKGKVGGQFWSVYMPCTPNVTDYTTTLRDVVEQIDLVKRMVDKYTDVFQMAYSVADIRQAFRHGKIASLVGMEGGHSMDDSLGVLRQLYALGARYMTLTHTCHTAWADSAAPPPLHNGLTLFGESVVSEMNRLGMLVDISHVSPDTMRHVARVSQAPLFFSHSSAAALCNITRNVPDDVLEMVKEKGGIVMVNFFSIFVSCNTTATLSQVADHIVHIKKVAGAQHIGLGADYDGINSWPEGLRDVSTYPNLIAELLSRGFTESEVRGIASDNLIRVLDETERVSRRLNSMKPVEETLRINKTCPIRAEEL
ncbi:hypothetical protein SmJEL517_g01679 [Synchytrium microbalum]|uniref:Dipeptidase n=1 Tax=Synchytrium microbalum TaxID=1806994 RepID=A0A507C2Y9_9FUNG|nr:uncharacterized protein SmJEL517_g01679 [Synchytrium microbalum]TPX35880.1 hypothetical protein SmJEL517_g01679 [Synchytrium microbalum]